MKASSCGIQKPIVPPPIIAVALSFFGWALIEAWLASLHAGLASHVFVSVPGLFLVSLSIRRAPEFRFWLFHTGTNVAQFRRLNTGDAGTALLLCGTGWLLGALVLHGTSFPLLVVAIGIHFVPWWRLRLCREHFFGASTLLWLTACLVTANGYRIIDFMTLPIAGWTLWTAACFSVLQSLARTWHAERTALSIKA